MKLLRALIKAHYRILNKLESITPKYILREAALRSSFGSKEKFFFFFFSFQCKQAFK